LADAGRTIGVSFNGSVAHVAISGRALAVTRRWLRRGFDVVHVHEPLVPLVSTTALATAAPLVATFHASLSGERLAKPWWRAHARALRKLEASIAVSPAAAASVETLTSLDARVIPNAISFAGRSQPRPGDPREHTHPTAVFVGRFDEPRKGLQVALDAMTEIRATYRNFELLVVGPGTPIPQEGVRYLGSVSADQRDAVLSIADMLLAPNTGQESFGLVLIEALAQGLRVVASDLPAFREVLSIESDQSDPGPSRNEPVRNNPAARDVSHSDRADGEIPAGCVLFPAGDSSALAAAVLRALAIPASKVAPAAYTHAQRYSWDVVGPQILAVYQQVTEASRDETVQAADEPLANSSANKPPLWQRLRHRITHTVVAAKLRAPSTTDHAVQ
jgi:phosphatidylinositol alpha-mannosyltransferase